MTKDELQVKAKEKRLWIKMLPSGGFGTGKTYFSMTFPKWAYAQIEPNGLQTAITHPNLLENMVEAEAFTPTNDEDIKVTFERLKVWIEKIRERAKKGEVETFILDNLTHLSQARWMFIEKYEKTFGKSGAVDTLAMFGNLNRWLSRFILTEVVTLPCHVVVPVHEMEEEEKDETGKSSKTGRTIVNTLGGFRNDAAGFFNASIFLTVKREANGTHKYIAQCKPSPSKPAKNNIGLPEFVENVSYGKIMEVLGNVTEQQKKQ